MPRGRPRGSKGKSKVGYDKRTRMLRRKFGNDIFRRWGKKGGNPILLKQKSLKQKRRRAGK